MKLLLVTGAGASRDLNYDSEDQLPLMADWSGHLCRALDARAEGLAQGCGLTPDANGPTFETSIGDLLHWRQAQPLAHKFASLGNPNQPNGRLSHADGHLMATEKWLDVAMDVLNVTLFDLFGQRKIDSERAWAAYNWLINRVGVEELVIATTNYDRSAEAGLRDGNFEIRTGFHSLGENVPVFRPRGMLRDVAPQVTPVLHLHGAVGWYEVDGNVEDHYGDKRFNSNYGTPVVLYPDPGKDPATEAFMSDLWQEFSQAALDWADHILVVGHSLNDPPVVRALREAIDLTEVRLGVGFVDDSGQRAISHAFDDDAVAIPLRFGPDPSCDDAALDKWAA